MGEPATDGPGREVSSRDDEPVGEDAEEEEARAVKAPRRPCEPTEEERRLHEILHLPYRSWCRYCVEGRGQHAPHYGTRSEEPRIPEVHVDYAFFRDKEGAPSVPVIVLKHRQSRALAAHVVPHKGGDHEWAVAQCVRDTRKWGMHGDLIMQRPGGCPQGAGG